MRTATIAACAQTRTSATPATPTVVNSGAISTDTNSPSATASVSGTPATNEIILAHVTITGLSGATSTITPPSGEGFAQVAAPVDPAGSDCQLALYWKRWGVGSTDNTSVAFTGTAGGMRLVLTRLSGCKTTGNPYSDNVSDNGGGAGTGTTVTAPTAVGGANKRVMRFFSCSATTVTVTPDTGTVAYGGGSYGFTAGVDGACACSHADSSSNPTGTATATASQTLANGWAALTVAFSG